MRKIWNAITEMAWRFEPQRVKLIHEAERATMIASREKAHA